MENFGGVTGLYLCNRPARVRGINQKNLLTFSKNEFIFVYEIKLRL